MGNVIDKGTCNAVEAVEILLICLIYTRHTSWHLL